MAQFKRSLCLALATMALPVLSQLKWPEHNPPLAPGPSASPVQATLPADVSIQAPDAALPPARARWSGKWVGWSCAGASCSARLAVEKVGQEGASFVYVSGSSSVKPNPQRVEGKFVGDELHGTLASGSKVAYRFRADNALDFVLVTGNGNVVSGVLTKE